MTNKQEKQVACVTDEARESASGYAINPRELPDAADEDAERKSVTHGRPISQAAYKRQKERAAEADVPASPHAQEDPST